jgi:2-succinyl-6-hydroxy-2,4-cyclohexadiene-1-carboxylate synthase
MADSSLGSRRFGRAGKPTVVLLHGFLGSGEDWIPVGEFLASRFDLLTIDLPGHGASSGISPEYFDFESCCTAIADLVSRQGISKCAVVGYSMGGRLAMYFAMRYPEYVHSLVVVSASPGIESEPARLSRLASDEQLAERLESMRLDQFVDEWYQQPLFASLRHSAAYDAVAAARSGGARAALARALVGFSVGRQHSLWDKLSTLNFPVCYVAGEQDGKYTDIGRRAADLCPQGKLHIIPGAGHAVHIEQPGELSRVIASFVQPHS